MGKGEMEVGKEEKIEGKMNKRRKGGGGRCPDLD